MRMPQPHPEPLSENFSPPPRLYKRILVGYNGSPSAEAALRTGRELALMSRSDLFVAAIECLPNSDSTDAFQTAVTAVLRRYQENFYRLRIAGLNEGTRVETFLALGDPAAFLVRKARQLRASLLIVATDFALSGGQADSVCERVVRETTCPVLVTPVTVATVRTDEVG